MVPNGRKFDVDHEKMASQKNGRWCVQEGANERKDNRQAPRFVKACLIHAIP